MTFSPQDCITFGWNQFQKRPWFFVAIPFVAILMGIIGGIVLGIPAGIIGFAAGDSGMKAASALVRIVVEVFIQLGVVAVYLKAHDDVSSAQIRDLWQPKKFLPFLVLSLLAGIATILGFILLIIPGIIALIAFSLSPYLLVERGLGPIDAIKESLRLTKGHRVSIFVLMLFAVGINILGLLALFIGIFVTAPITMLAFVHMYRQLAGVSVVAETPATPELVTEPAIS
jgi:uncharacterized membrane protein